MPFRGQFGRICAQCVFVASVWRPDRVAIRWSSHTRQGL
ncbi:hypothetical protein PEPIB1_42 (plasmid) [Tritonibacter mobilis]|nr:hypothetical protein PEPIB1_42 [Tritonibacter mobilis]